MYVVVVLLYQYSFIEIFLSFSNHASNVQRCDYLPLQKVVELQHTMMKQGGQECLQCSGTVQFTNTSSTVSWSTQYCGSYAAATQHSRHGRPRLLRGFDCFSSAHLCTG